MGVLTRNMRQQLLIILAGMPNMATSSGRSLLLQYLLPALVRTIERDDAPASDLANIVAACENWEPPPIIMIPEIRTRR